MKLFKKKKEKFPTPPVPRSLEEVQKDYNSVAMQAGGAQYEIEVRKADLDRLNRRMREIQQEAYARQQLDKQAKPEASPEAKAEETK